MSVPGGPIRSQSAIGTTKATKNIELFPKLPKAIPRVLISLEFMTLRFSNYALISSSLCASWYFVSPP